jgi:hypothetical protein
MAQKNKLIAISEKNYQVLSSLGTVSDSFDTVMTRVLEAAIPSLRKEEAKT